MEKNLILKYSKLNYSKLLKTEKLTMAKINTGFGA